MPPTTLFHRPAPLLRSALRPRSAPGRVHPFSTSHRRCQQQHKESSGSIWSNWRPIPIAAGIAVVGGIQMFRTYAQVRKTADDEWAERDSEKDPEDDQGKPRRRKRIRPSGPWTVQIMSTLPLKALSRLWGKFNSLDIPYYLRVPGFKLYGWVFGVNFDEIEEKDLHNFRNLAEFFYRTLKPGVRPLDAHPNALLSPADGKVVQFGVIEHGDIEQVKGVTYSVDALLGERKGSDDTPTATSNIASSSKSHRPSADRETHGDEEVIKADEEFARVNGISYDLPSLFSGAAAPSNQKKARQPRTREGALLSKEEAAAAAVPVKEDAKDQSTHSTASSEAEVRSALASFPSATRPWWTPGDQQDIPTSLYYCVVYLAPGDYHRFHSPVSWVVESRRHFAGELYSVSPYLQRTLPGLFTLNERVVLLGRWKYGFFSYTPVGATNVGSIVVNFDRELRTNSLLTDTQADRAAERAAERGEPYSGYAEATYGSASRVLGGHALSKGEEMGGFQLGSTIVMVFEAPKGRRPTFDEGFMAGDEDGRKGGWRWCIEKGMHVKVGERLGFAPEEE